jgi:hypothetical protein
MVCFCIWALFGLYVWALFGLYLGSIWALVGPEAATDDAAPVRAGGRTDIRVGGRPDEEAGEQSGG